MYDEFNCFQILIIYHQASLQNFKNSVLHFQDTNIWIQGAKVVQRDIFAKNGVIHLIDQVLFPPANSLEDMLADTSQLSRMNDYLERTALKIPTGFTMFVPTDSALQMLSQSGKDLLQKNSRLLKVSSIYEFRLNYRYYCLHHCLPYCQSCNL